MYMWGQMRFPKKLPHVLALGAVIIVVTSLIVIISYWLRNIGNPSSKKNNISSKIFTIHSNFRSSFNC